MSSQRRTRTTSRKSRERLRAAFLEQLDDQLAEVGLLLEGARVDAAMREAAADMLERLAETADSIGLPTIAAAARGAERGEPLHQVVQAVSRAARKDEHHGPAFAPIHLLVGNGAAAWQRHCDILPVPVLVFDDITALIDAARRQPPHAVVAPLDALRKLQAVLAPRFALGPGDLDSRRQAVRLGAWAYLEEPLELEQMVHRVLSAVPQQRQSRVLMVGGVGKRVAEIEAALEEQRMVCRRSAVPQDLLADLDALQPQAVLIVSPLGDADASELALVLRSHHRWGDLPLVGVGLRRRQAVLDAVLDEQLPADAPAATLALRLRGRIARFQQSRARSLWDGGFGAATRLATLDVLDRAVAQARRDGPGVAVAVVGLESDRELAPRGRERLMDVVTQVLRRGVRRSDCVGRLDEERLLLVLPGCTASQAAARLEEVQALVPAALGTRQTGFGFSAGVVDTGDGTHALIRRADGALGAARTAGGARVVVR